MEIIFSFLVIVGIISLIGKWLGNSSDGKGGLTENEKFDFLNKNK